MTRVRAHLALIESRGDVLPPKEEADVNVPHSVPGDRWSLSDSSSVDLECLDKMSLRSRSMDPAMLLPARRGVSCKLPLK